MKPDWDVRIVVSRYRGKPYFSPHFAECDQPARIHFDNLPELIVQCQAWGCTEVRISPEAEELHTADPYIGWWPWEDCLDSARAELERKQARREAGR